MAAIFGIGAAGFDDPDGVATVPSTELQSGAAQTEFDGNPDRLLDRVARLRRAHAEHDLAELDEAVQLAQFTNWSNSDTSGK